MADLIDYLAPHVSRREALAEAALLFAFQSQSVLKKFQELTGLDRRSTIVRAVQQECGADGEARHDLVLYSTGKKKFRIELKGDAPYTKRQLRALEMGSKAPEDIRIDVLILPKWMPPPAQTAPSVRIVTWAQVDKEVLGRKGIGNLESLWLGTQRFPKACLTADARRYIAFMRGQVTGTTWRSLWQSLDYLKGSLSMDLGFGRCAGPKQAKTWYYGVQAHCENGDARWWLTWVFEGGRAGRLKMALALMDRDGAAPAGGDPLQLLRAAAPCLATRRE